MVRNYKRKTVDRWTKEDLLEALTNIKEAKLKINDAARQYHISRATLYRQFKKFLQAGGKWDVNQFRTCGGNPILTKVEEDVLEKTIRDLREQGFTVTSSDIKRICFEYCDSNGIPNQFNQDKRMASDDWYYGFLKRHPDVRIDGQTPELPAKPKKKKKRAGEEFKGESSGSGGGFGVGGNKGGKLVGGAKLLKRKMDNSPSGSPSKAPKLEEVIVKSEVEMEGDDDPEEPEEPEEIRPDNRVETDEEEDCKEDEEGEEDEDEDEEEDKEEEEDEEDDEEEEEEDEGLTSG